MNPRVMNSADQNEYNRARMHHDDARRGRPACPPQVQAMFDAVHMQANPVHRTSQAKEKVSQIHKGTSQVTSEMEEKREDAMDERNRIAWSETVSCDAASRAGLLYLFASSHLWITFVCVASGSWP